MVPCPQLYIEDVLYLVMGRKSFRTYDTMNSENVWTMLNRRRIKDISSTFRGDGNHCDAAQLYYRQSVEAGWQRSAAEAS